MLLYLSCSYSMYDTFKVVMPLLQIYDHVVAHSVYAYSINFSHNY